MLWRRRANPWCALPGAAMLEEKAARIELLVLDVDGVMTDGRIILNDRGEETKHFHVKDGQGLKMLIAAGVHVAIMTGRESDVVAHHCP